jgi:hypothetical protein
MEPVELPELQAVMDNMAAETMTRTDALKLFPRVYPPWNKMADM